MRLFATATDGTTSENIDRIFDGIFGIFDNLAEVGAGWGGPWEWLFPTFVALFVVLAFFGGFRYVFELSQDKVKPIFFFALLILGVLAFVAIRGDADQNATSNGLAVLSG